MLSLGHVPNRLHAGRERDGNILRVSVSRTSAPARMKKALIRIRQMLFMLWFRNVNLFVNGGWFTIQPVANGRFEPRDPPPRKPSGYVGGARFATV